MRAFVRLHVFEPTNRTERMKLCGTGSEGQKERKVKGQGSKAHTVLCCASAAAHQREDSPKETTTLPQPRPGGVDDDVCLFVWDLIEIPFSHRP